MLDPIENRAAYSKKELEDMLVKMRRASDIFYSMATKIGNHAFIEFTGLMNEYINVCHDTLNEGKDFTTFNIHNRKSMIKPHQQDYMREKIECIFGVRLKIFVMDHQGKMIPEGNIV